MREEKDRVLHGQNNKRLGSVRETNNEGTAAWANIEKEIPESKVSIPSEYDVEKAKNWVDNGSQL